MSIKGKLSLLLSSILFTTFTTLIGVKIGYAEITDSGTIIQQTNEIDKVINETSIEEVTEINEKDNAIKNEDSINITTDEGNQIEIVNPLNEEHISINNDNENIKVEAPTDSIVDNTGTNSNQSLLLPSLTYSTHIQDYGWQKPVLNGEISGTVGKSKRLEAIQITGIPGISYRTHVQDFGWQDFVSDGALSGTEGKAKRLEAIQIKLTGESANQYDIYYRVHAQDYGWLGWAKNGQSAGTAGLAKRLEAIEIKLVPKGGTSPGSTANPFVIDPSVTYSTHVQNYGWMKYVKDGVLSGTSGEAKRLEAIKVKLTNNPYSGNIVYSTHVQDYGWLPNVKNGAMSGTSGKSKRLEAITIDLTGEVADHFDIYYRVHIQDHGWLGWAKNGMKAGSQNQSKRLEAIEIKLVPKGQGEPVEITKAFKTPKYTINRQYNLTLNDAVDIQIALTNPAPQTDIDPIGYIKAEDADVYGSISGYGVNLRVSPNLNSQIGAYLNNGTNFMVLDDDVTGDTFQGSTRWFKIMYNGQTLFVHSKLAKIDYAVVTKENVSILEQADTNSYIFATAKAGAHLPILNVGELWHEVKYDTPGWRNASAGEVSDYINPANFVNDEKQSLQFMDLSKQVYISVDALNQYLKGKGILEGKGQVYIDAGRTYGVNVVYLLAHSLLETGHGTSKLATGVTYNGKIVHNMYGIGAFDSNATVAGSKKAYELGWFDEDAAIKGGAKWIKDNYISDGQNTLYEMRWNPESMDTLGYASHQYASDIGWAYKQMNALYKIMNDLYQIQPYTLYLEVPIYK